MWIREDCWLEIERRNRRKYNGEARVKENCTEDMMKEDEYNRGASGNMKVVKKNPRHPTRHFLTE